VKKRDPEQRYFDNLRHEQKTLEEFAAHEGEWSEDLLYWYKLRGEDIPDDQYRAAAFFINREYQAKPGSLTLLYLLFKQIMIELPPVTKENGFDQLCFRFKCYASALEKGGY
jgi:hypothetical protein